jgi:hypothetical protein
VTVDLTTVRPSTSAIPFTIADLEKSFVTFTVMRKLSPGKTGSMKRVRVVPTRKMRPPTSAAPRSAGRVGWKPADLSHEGPRHDGNLGKWRRKARCR